ncbi:MULTISPECIES: DUF1127 domain-containing protein [Rhodobacter]|uniref:DUF1127 domain-containing protein n=1 Tax=Rhodobacter TaxID=1060 RepID=UPI000970CCCE|nr:MULTISPECIES: DUF1127 domain-containing protein [Rhodobacter]SOC15777.1 uncharacterized protein DUF1127 [Rhodobacter sp. JA431]
MSVIDSYRLSARADRAGLFTRVVEAVTLWRDARVTRRTLARFTDRELSDIGLTRFDLDRIGR